MPVVPDNVVSCRDDERKLSRQTGTTAMIDEYEREGTG